MPRPYPQEFREGAIALVRGGRSVTDVARELGIADSCLRNWPRHGSADRFGPRLAGSVGVRYLGVTTPDALCLAHARVELVAYRVAN